MIGKIIFVFIFYNKRLYRTSLTLLLNEMECSGGRGTAKKCTFNPADHYKTQFIIKYKDNKSYNNNNNNTQ